jgi:hypothetical protein
LRARKGRGQQPHGGEHAEHADDGAADTIAPVHALARRKAAAKSDPRGVAQRLPPAGKEQEEQERHEQPRLRRLPAQEAHHVVDERDREHDAERESAPRHDAGDEAKAVAEVAGGDHRRDDDEVEDVHSPGTSRRAWVRNPVWATIRWSGRTD